jgi:hypothetical protein
MPHPHRNSTLPNPNLKNIYGSFSNPIYIYVPGFIEESAGIRSLHYLCHALNSAGHPAWLVIHGTILESQAIVSGFLNTPVLTQEISNSHFRFGLAPIVVYPETIPGNPLNAQVIVRYLMNYSGTLGGPKFFPKNELCVAFSQKIADQYDKQIPVLFIPPIDIREVLKFRKTAKNSHQGPVLFYAAKYRGFVGKPKLPNWTLKYNPQELFREGTQKHSRSELLTAISESYGLIVFENSSVITEATLLGTPVILVKSDFFNELIAEEELGDAGCNWSEEVTTFDDVRVNYKLAEDNYMLAITTFEENLKVIVREWKMFAKESDYLAPIVIPGYNKIFTAHRVSMAIQIIRSLGLRAFSRVLVSFIKRRISRGLNR